MDKNVASLNQRVLYLTSTMQDYRLSTDYKVVLQLPDLKNYKFKKISLISCMIPNLFLTFQGNNTNNEFSIEYVICLYENDYQTIRKRITKTINYEIKEGYYDSSEEDILKVINDTLMQTTVGDLTNEENNKTPLYVKPPIHFNTQDPHSHTLQFDAYFNLPPMWIMNEITFTLKNLFYRIIGGKRENEEIILNKDEDMPIYNHYIYTFPEVPNAIWVNSVQIRFSIVDGSEDSNIVANIPITDSTQDFISYINPQIEENAKTVSSNINTLMEVQLTNQDGYEIKMKDYNFDIKLF